MTDDIQLAELKDEVRRLGEENSQVRATIQSWLDQQGHNRCWYYPELFRQLVQILQLTMTVEPSLPPRCEFEGGCRRYQDEEYGLSPMRYIPQRLGRDCSIAALAMATEHDYEQILETFESVDFDKGGISYHGVDYYLVKNNFAIQRKFEFTGYRVDGPKVTPWPCLPFARRHLCEVLPAANSPCSHFIAMDEQGTVFDPAIPERKSLGEYHKTWNIAGIYRL
jgi:hypothetical protein